MRHLDLLNVFLALRFKQPGFPTCLADLGYLVHSVGVTLSLPDGTKVVPDVMTSQPDRKLSLLVEVKSGKQVDGAQLQRMLNVTPRIARDHAYVAVPELSSYRVQVVYFCNDEHRTELQEQIANPAVSVIGFDGARFRTSGASIADPELATCLAKSEVASNAAQLAIIPFDRESRDDEVARAIIPHVVNAWVTGAGTVRPDLLVSQTHYLVHADMSSTGSGSELADITKRVRTVLEGLAKGELSDLLERVPAQPAWRFRRGLPSDSTRTRELQKVQKAAERYLESVGAGKGMQLELLFSDDEN